MVSPPHSTRTQTFAATGVSNVILASTSQFTLESFPLYCPPSPGALRLITMRQGLQERGFNRVSIFTSPPDRAPDIERDRRAIVDQFTAMGAAERGAVIGLSTTSHEYFKFEPLARLIREPFPDTPLIAGGVHFFRDRIEGVPDTLEILLLSGLADGVQVGDAEGFDDLITKYAGDMERVNGHGLYRIDPDSRKIVGSGIGHYPALHSLPLELDPRLRAVSTLLKEACVHKCAYCSAKLGAGYEFPADRAIEDLNRVLSSNDVGLLTIYDSNPFQKEDMEYYEQILSSLHNRESLCTSTYLNPLQLLDDALAERIFMVLLSSPAHLFYVGRNTVSADIAEKIGNNDHCRPKTQRQLDDERRAIMNFIREFKRSYRVRNSRSRTRFTLSYLITPFETMHSLKTMVEEIIKFVELSDGNVEVVPAFHPLMPNPGTELRRKFKDAIQMDAFDFENLRDGGISPWKMKGGMTDFGMRLMAKVARLTAERNINPAWFLFQLVKGEVDIDGAERRVNGSTAGGMGRIAHHDSATTRRTRRGLGRRVAGRMRSGAPGVHARTRGLRTV